MKAVTVGRFQDGGEHGLCSFGEHIELPMVPSTRGSSCLKTQLSLIIHWAVGPERSIRSWTIHWSHLGVRCRGIQDCPGPGCRNEVHKWIPSITMYYYSILFLATFAIWDDDHDDHDDPSNFHDLHWYCDFSRGSNMFKTPFNNRLELVRSICQGRRACTGWNWQSCMELSGPVGEDWTSDGNEFQWEYIEYLYIYN